MSKFEGEFVLKMRTEGGKLKHEFRFTRTELIELKLAVAELLNESNAFIVNQPLRDLFTPVPFTYTSTGMDTTAESTGSDQCTTYTANGSSDMFGDKRSGE